MRLHGSRNIAVVVVSVAVRRRRQLGTSFPGLECLRFARLAGLARFTWLSRLALLILLLRLSLRCNGFLLLRLLLGLLRLLRLLLLHLEGFNLSLESLDLGLLLLVHVRSGHLHRLLVHLKLHLHLCDLGLLRCEHAHVWHHTHGLRLHHALSHVLARVLHVAHVLMTVVRLCHLLLVVHLLLLVMNLLLLLLLHLSRFRLLHLRRFRLLLLHWLGLLLLFRLLLLRLEQR
mmetsp:Transcript_1559/g.3642  ORF Transcript_1559/g.3642 Transcript_1559/m.3642 type:complete len:231 (-) Transcript_1559:780-1472(-)